MARRQTPKFACSVRLHVATILEVVLVLDCVLLSLRYRTSFLLLVVPQYTNKARIYEEASFQ